MDNSKILNIISDIEKYESNTFEDNVKNRLELTLTRYIESLNNSYSYLVARLDKKSIIRGLIK